jgi:hypothetical protein
MEWVITAAVLLACPVAMWVMMRAMASNRRRRDDAGGPPGRPGEGGTEREL